MDNKKCRFLMSMFAVAMLSCHAPAIAQDNGNLGLRTVVIDPGHGGKDSGAPGQTPSTSEKHIVLSIGKLLGEKISKSYPEVKVVYTRKTDVFVELNERANIAKRNKADLFISIHCNSNPSKSPYGASAHILGPKSSNSKNNGDYFAKSMSVARRENSVMLLEENYETTYKGFDPDSPESVITHSLMWNANYENSLMLAAEMDEQFHKPPFRQSQYTGIHQDVFYLLWATNMPAVLLELGFISNPTDFKYLSTESGQKQVADRLFEAFCKYKAYYDGSMNPSSVQGETQPAPAATAPVKTQDEAKAPSGNVPSGDEYYAVQIMGLGRYIKPGDPAFKGLETRAIKAEDSNIYKYVTAWSNTRDGAAASLSAVRKKFPEAFIVKVSGDKVTRN
ncbi:MAG: N-acetylmuramoyl-L-alanine amidase [Candidatus Cryptobacteroides sp.]